MKLRTKFKDDDFKLGEVVDASIMYGCGDKIEVYCAEKTKLRIYNSIKDFIDHWEDAPEELSRHWFITGTRAYEENCYSDEAIADLESVGNHFKTKEEAEKTLDKLKAWKRLKDKGFKFKGWDWEDDPSKIEIKFRCPDESCLSLFDIQDDLDLLFLGGEE